MAEKSDRPSLRSTDDNRGWFRRALAALAASGIVLGSLVLMATAADAAPRGRPRHRTPGRPR